MQFFYKKIGELAYPPHFFPAPSIAMEEGAGKKRKLGKRERAALLLQKQGGGGPAGPDEGGAAPAASAKQGPASAAIPRGPKPARGPAEAPKGRCPPQQQQNKKQKTPKEPPPQPPKHRGGDGAGGGGQGSGAPRVGKQKAQRETPPPPKRRRGGDDDEFDGEMDGLGASPQPPPSRKGPATAAASRGPGGGDGAARPPRVDFSLDAAAAAPVDQARWLRASCEASTAGEGEPPSTVWALPAGPPTNIQARGAIGSLGGTAATSFAAFRLRSRASRVPFGATGGFAAGLLN